MYFEELYKKNEVLINLYNLLLLNYVVAIHMQLLLIIIFMINLQDFYLHFNKLPTNFLKMIYKK